MTSAPLIPPPEARSVFADPYAFRVSTSVALLIDSPFSRVIGNFYLGFNKSLTPSRLFIDPDEARQWLRETHAAATESAWTKLTAVP